jgi:hypothetical protein
VFKKNLDDKTKSNKKWGGGETVSVRQTHYYAAELRISTVGNNICSSAVSSVLSEGLIVLISGTTYWLCELCVRARARVRVCVCVCQLGLCLQHRKGLLRTPALSK